MNTTAKNPKAVISISARTNTRERFEELFQESESNSKAEFLEKLMNSFVSEPDNQVMPDPMPALAPQVVQSQEPVASVAQEPGSAILVTEDFLELPEEEQEREPVELGENEIIVRLNPVQLYALRNHTSLKGFVEEANRGIEDWLRKKSMWSGKAKFPGFFTLFTEGMTPNEVMGNYLINVYMTMLANYMFGDEANLEDVRKFGWELQEKERTEEAQ